jgi:4-hydroxy-3-methylbut-2-en-1-yl diphosphate reductase
LKIVIDENAGVCPGVAKAIKLVEERLNQEQSLTSLGSVIHNYYEIERLKEKGLRVDSGNDPERPFKHKENNCYFVRSHGIPKAYTARLEIENVDYIDGTCSIVKRVQKRIEEFYNDSFQIVIIGKKTHPEVIGLNGYCNNEAVVVREDDDIEQINPHLKTVMLAQTTIGKERFKDMAKKIKTVVNDLEIVDTTCNHINKRNNNLAEFAQVVDVVLMVGGSTSSNTGVLHNICYEQNKRSYRIESAGEIKHAWFKPDDCIGITGSASTPLWQLELVKDFLEKIPR